MVRQDDRVLEDREVNLDHPVRPVQLELPESVAEMVSLDLRVNVDSVESQDCLVHWVLLVRLVYQVNKERGELRESGVNQDNLEKLVSLDVLGHLDHLDHKASEACPVKLVCQGSKDPEDLEDLLENQDREASSFKMIQVLKFNYRGMFIKREAHI